MQELMADMKTAFDEQIVDLQGTIDELKEELSESSSDSNSFQLHFQFSESKTQVPIDLASYNKPLIAQDNGIKNVSIVFNNQKKREHSDKSGGPLMDDDEEEEFKEKLEDYNKYIILKVSNINNPKEEKKDDLDQNRRRLDGHGDGDAMESSFTLDDGTEL